MHYSKGDTALQDVAKIVSLCMDASGEDDPDFCRAVRMHQKKLFESIKASKKKDAGEKANTALEQETPEMLGVPSDDKIDPAIMAELLSPKTATMPSNTKPITHTTKTSFVEIDAANPMVKVGNPLLWPKAVVTYCKDATSPGWDNVWHNTVIQQALDTWAVTTCVAFDLVECSASGDKVKFISNTGKPFYVHFETALRLL